MARSRTSRCDRVARRFWSSSSWRTWARSAGGRVAAPSAPRVRSSSARSAASRSSVAAFASACAVSTRSPAASTASPTPRIVARDAEHRPRAGAAPRGRGRAAARCRRGSARRVRRSPRPAGRSRRGDTSRVATASIGGTRSATERDRDRIVTSTSCGLGAHSSHTVRAGGLLDRLEQGVDAVLDQPVGVLDDDHAAPTLGRRALRELHQRAGGVDADDDALGRDDRDVGVRPRRMVVHAWQCRTRPARTAAPRRTRAPRWTAPSRAGR